MHKVLILDFGSQYTQLIARRIREMNVYCEIHPCTMPYDRIQAFGAQALILSGGPASVLGKKSPRVDARLLDGKLPVLGICYGMQLMTHLLGGKVIAAKHREYGAMNVKIMNDHSFFADVNRETGVWMSHGDSLQNLPAGFQLLAESITGVPAAMAHTTLPLVALQFHPEVHHSVEGKKMLGNFLFKIAGLKADWNMDDFIERECIRIREVVGKDRVILGLSGGVDSSVAAALIHKAIGNQLTCIFINNGLLRLNEDKQVVALFRRNFKMKLLAVDATKDFMKALKGVRDPERKRKIIGKVFVDVFLREAKKIRNVKFLAQGTLYPDVIESVSFKGPSAVIKSHHNVGGLPAKLHLQLLEPLRELFKDEVRDLGRRLGLPHEVLGRHPFPGPGLGIRILGPISSEKTDLVKKADAIFIEEIRNAGWYDKIWQAFCVLLPVQSVGVMGDERTYENTLALRAVDSVDGMTADWVDLPKDLLARVSNRIINEVRGINRVVYDISSKPPATIEWE